MKLCPLVFGEGIPLLARRHGTTALELRDARAYRNGVQLLTYQVVPAAVLSGRTAGEVAHMG